MGANDGDGHSTVRNYDLGGRRQERRLISTLGQRQIKRSANRSLLRRRRKYHIRVKGEDVKGDHVGTEPILIHVWVGRGERQISK